MNRCILETEILSRESMKSFLRRGLIFLYGKEAERLWRAVPKKRSTGWKVKFYFRIDWKSCGTSLTRKYKNLSRERRSNCLGLETYFKLDILL